MYIVCRYMELNVRSLNSVRTYDKAVPEFLRNRPKFLVAHCLRRLPPKVSAIPAVNIVDSSDGVFIVTSSDGEANYTVHLRSELDTTVPLCECADWSRHCLPCKHVLAVLTHCCPGTEWISLPEYYRSLPFFSLDPHVCTVGHFSTYLSCIYCCRHLLHNAHVCLSLRQL